MIDEVNPKQSDRSGRGAWRAILPFLMLIGLVLAPTAYAQGDGPKSQAQIPINTPIFIPTFIHVHGNFSAAGNVLLPGADVKGGIFPMSYMESFNVGGHYAQIYVTPIYGQMDGDVFVTDPLTGTPIRRSISKSGFLDPVINFKVGLIGFEPMTLQEAMKKGDPGFQLGAALAVSPPLGSYDSDDALNLGSNVWSYRVASPMMIPLSKKQGGRVSTHWELMPSVTFYTDNDDPTGGANSVEQQPLFAVESHLLHDFNPKWWGSIDLRYYNGGETSTDGVDDGNRVAALGGGLTVSHAFTPKFSVQGTWGKVLHGGSNNVDLEQYRLKAVLIF